MGDQLAEATGGPDPHELVAEARRKLDAKGEGGSLGRLRLDAALRRAAGATSYHELMKVVKSQIDLLTIWKDALEDLQTRANELEA